LKEQSPMPISFLCHGLFNGVIGWVKTQENVALTRETRPGM
jgi:hypothetical protein